MKESKKDPKIEEYWDSSSSSSWPSSSSSEPLADKAGESKKEIKMIPVLTTSKDDVQSSIILSDVCDISKEKAPKLRIATYVIDREPDYVIIDQYGRYIKPEPTVKSKWE